jgi:hypothetical protein
MSRPAFLAGTAALTAAMCAEILAQQPAGDVLLRAMRDELERSRKLSVATLEAPYFIQYGMNQSDLFAVSASLGGVVSYRRDSFRLPEFQVRVGDYKFDNTNYNGSGFAFGGR